MSELTLTRTRIHAGVYGAILTRAGERDAAEAPPELVVLHQSLPLAGLTLSPDPAMPGTWHVSVPIPADLLTDGVQTFLVKEQSTGDTLDSFSIVTGDPLEDDIRAEVELLRAELDLLKSAFRRHCLETAS